MRLEGLTRKSRSTEPGLPWHTRLYTSGPWKTCPASRSYVFATCISVTFPPLQNFFWLVFHSNAYVNSPFIFLIAFPMFILTSLGKKFRHIQLSTDSGYLKNSIAALYIVDMFFISSEPMLDRGDDSVHIA